jgi:hypothetical protein
LINVDGRTKASRARKKLAKLAIQKEEKKHAILIIVLDWESEEDSDERAFVSP